MKTLTIEIPEKVKKTILDLVELLGGKVIDLPSKKDRDLGSKGKLSQKEEKFIKGLEEANGVVNDYQEGKAEIKSIAKEAEIFKNIGTQVFIKKRKTYLYSTLIEGEVLGPNTYRGFHKIDKTKPGAKEAFENVLSTNKDFIILELKKVKSEKDLNDLEEDICAKLKSSLRKNIDNRQLDSYNKLRKPIDIVFEHFIAMGKDFADIKGIITPFLYLPLDSQMFQSEFVFTNDEIKELNIKRSFTFKDIVSKQQYYEIQDYLKVKAQRLGFENRIYFDLVWDDRYKKESDEIF